MKVKKKVEFPEERPLPFKEFRKYKTKATNYAVWYATTYTRNSQQVRDILVEKGYPKEPISYIDYDDTILEFDFCEHIIAYLEEMSILDDDHYAQAFVDRSLRQGQSVNKIKQSMIAKKFDRDVIETVLEGIESEELEEALDKSLSHVLSLSAVYNIEEPYKRRQKVVQKLMSKGFSYHDIVDRYDLLQDEHGND